MRDAIAARRPRRGLSVASAFLLAAAVLSGCGKDGEEQFPFSNPVIAGLWSSDRMEGAASRDNLVANDTEEDAGKTDPPPQAVPADGQPTPYRGTAPVIGKLFFDTSEGPSVCSATAVADPARPGASSLVWTAGHCVHGGAGGGWFRNIVFVPSYNDEGLRGAARKDAGMDRIAPLGVWWADDARTSREWTEQGTATGGAGASFDYAVLHVRSPDGAASLQEQTGQAVPVWIGAPSATRIPAVKAWGYPAEAPFDGESMWSCQDRPRRLSFGDDLPTMFRIGCTMTGGSSGGGWFAQDPEGKLALISNTSIGPEDNTWLAGPRLGDGARSVYEAMSDGADSTS